MNISTELGLLTSSGRMCGLQVTTADAKRKKEKKNSNSALVLISSNDEVNTLHEDEFRKKTFSSSCDV